MYSGVSLMETKKRWTENCKYFSKQFYFNQYQGWYSFDNDLTFLRKNGSVYSFFSLSIPVISIQAGAGVFSVKEEILRTCKGRKGEGAFVASASSPPCVFPLHSPFKKNSACYAGYIQTCLRICFCQTNDAKSAWSLWVLNLWLT